MRPSWIYLQSIPLQALGHRTTGAMDFNHIGCSIAPQDDSDRICTYNRSLRRREFYLLNYGI